MRDVTGRIEHIYWLKLRNSHNANGPVNQGSQNGDYKARYKYDIGGNRDERDIAFP